MTKQELDIIDESTDELAEVIADFDLSDEELISVREDILDRVEYVQKMLLDLLTKETENDKS